MELPMNEINYLKNKADKDPSTDLNVQKKDRQANIKPQINLP